jgi:ribosomal protein S18 acetylase RimI-like enzyme
MTDVHYRWMEPDEVVRIAEINRAEQIRVGYTIECDHLQRIEVNWDTPDFIRDGQGEHSIGAQINFCCEHLNNGGCLLGAFDGDNLVGIGVLQPEIRKGIAQLANLQVSNGYRRLGIGSQIFKEIVLRAKDMGAESIYVSATPSGSAVGFYLSHGFEPVEVPIPELFELEPEDIHMLKQFS